jgi:putative addiction module component (TIGR02574 family)
MTTASIKQRLHEYIESAEDKKLKAIYTLLEDDIEDEHQLTDEQKAELDRRLYNYQNGIGKNYTWEETVVHIDQELQKRRNGK